jgi:hypothetical protein
MQKFGRVKALALIAVVFGAMTIFSGGRALFGDEQARAAVGNAIPFVLWFNFFAGFAYILTGIGLWHELRWAKLASLAIAGGTAIVGLAFTLHMLQGAAYESRTAVALLLRMSFWTVAAFLVWNVLPSSSPKTA